MLTTRANRVAAEFGISPDALRVRGKSNPRSLALADLRRQIHVVELLPYAVIARFPGGATAAVPGMIRRRRKGERDGQV